jgi:NAD+ synthase
MITNIPALENKLHELIRLETDVAVIGLSGGADSTLVACLCAKALGKDNVVGVHMPYDKKIDVEGTKFNAKSVRLARKLGIDRDIFCPITKIADEIMRVIDPATAHNFITRGGDANNLDRGNARARARMCVLYGLAGQLAHGDFKGKRVRVVGTGNLSEDFIGYDTKGGDALADFHPIGRLFKSEVYQFLDYLKENSVIEEEHIDRVPSAGLWEGQTDEGELGHTYNEMEPAIRSMLLPRRAGLTPTPSSTLSPTESFVLLRHLGNKHKHDAIPSLDTSEFLD